MGNALYDTTLNLLRRVDDDIILSVATREFRMPSPQACICGWIVREALAGLAGRPADVTDVWEDVPGGPRTEVDDPPDRCAALFGGRRATWNRLFYGVTDDAQLPSIELAFVQRVDEAVQGARP
jgi:hypothetical protein